MPTAPLHQGCAASQAIAASIVGLFLRQVLVAAASRRCRPTRGSRAARNATPALRQLAAPPAPIAAGGVALAVGDRLQHHRRARRHVRQPERDGEAHAVRRLDPVVLDNPHADRLGHPPAPSTRPPGWPNRAGAAWWRFGGGACSMDHVRFGSTGLKVSGSAWGPWAWAARPGRAGCWTRTLSPDPEARARPRHHLLRHGRLVFARPRRGGGRPQPAEDGAARGTGAGHQGLLSDERRSQRQGPVARAHPATRSTARCSGSGPTTSTSTSSTPSIRRRRSPRPWRRCTTSCGPARRATSAPRPCTPGSWPR